MCKKGVWKGGVAFERSGRSKHLDSGPRCYPVTQTYQVPKSMDAPFVGTKIYANGTDDNLRARKQVLTVSRFILLTLRIWS